MPQESAVFAEFFTEAVLLRHETEKQGRPVYKDMEHVKILVAGSRDEVVRLVEPADKDRFPDAWRRFTNANAEVNDGTPLKMWPPMTPSLIRHFENYNIRTVEQLSAIPDGSASQMGPDTRKWMDKARTWLSDAANGAENLARIDENKRLQERVAALEAQILAMGNKAVDEDAPEARKRKAA